MQGHYLYSDWCTGHIFSMRYDGGTVQDQQDRTAELGGPFNNIVSFGEDAAGTLYFMDGSGSLRRIIGECEVTNYCTGLPNSTGVGASISVSGSLSITENALTLEVDHAVGGQFGLFYYGPDTISQPFGDGLRCIGGEVYRLNPPQLVGGGGELTRHVDFTQPPANSGSGQILAGSTWNFQFWYRDPSGTGFNLSDAAALVFCQ